MSGGYAKHLHKLVPLLAARSEVLGLQLVTPKSNVAMRPAAASEFVHSQIGRFYATASRRPSRELLAVLSDFAPDVLFIPNFRALFISAWPNVAMVRNMETLDWNDRNDPIRHRVANRLRRIEGRLATRSAQRLIAVSGYVRDFLVQKWRLNPNGISVVYHGSDSSDGAGQVASKPRALPDAFPPFLLVAGSTKPSRGLEDMLAALANLPEPRPPLVVAGRAEPPFGNYEHALKRRAHALSNGATIFWLGMLEPSEMAWCYQNALLFVMTSRVEACPNIALESMSFGCPSIAADNKPLPEMYSDAALYYQPRQPDSLTARLMELMESADLRAALSKAGRARAQRFTWNQCAEGTVQALAFAIEDWRSPKQRTSWARAE